MHACMYVCMHAWMDVFMHACTHACMYVSKNHAHTHIHTHGQALTHAHILWHVATEFFYSPSLKNSHFKVTSDQIIRHVCLVPTTLFVCLNPALLHQSIKLLCALLDLHYLLNSPMLNLCYLAKLWWFGCTICGSRAQSRCSFLVQNSNSVCVCGIFHSPMMTPACLPMRLLIAVPSVHGSRFLLDDLHKTSNLKHFFKMHENQPPVIWII